MVQTFRTNVFVELYIASESEGKARAAKVNAVNVIPDAVITSPRIFALDTSRRFWLKGKKKRIFRDVSRQHNVAVSVEANVRAYAASY